MKINRKKAADLIKESNGSIFSVTFTKVDGTQRDMVCRLGVKKHLKGGVMSYNPADFNMVAVFDVQKLDYRMINLDSVSRLAIGGKEYKVS